MPFRGMFITILFYLSITIFSTAQESSIKVTDISSLQEKANKAYNAKDYEQAGKYFSQIAKTNTSPAINYFNAGCCFSLSGNLDESFEMLSKAIDVGYSNYTNLTGDSDLNNLRSDARFDTLLERVSKPKIVITDNVKQTAEEAEFVFDDVYNFLHAFKLIESGAELIPTLEKEYFAKATKGLKQFLLKYPFSVEDLVKAMNKYPENYKSIEKKVKLLESRIADFRKAYRQFKEIAPAIVFPPTYFMVGRNWGIASGSPDGLLISIERKTEESIWRIETTLIHELIHFQQLLTTGVDEFYAIFGAKKSLLALTLREGTGDFFAKLITKRTSRDDAWAYIIKNEREIWERFQKQMMSNETTNWMWSKPSDPEQPRDLAYALGAIIVEAYYQKEPDKQKAIHDILSVTDYLLFLEKSGYKEKFVQE